MFSIHRLYKSIVQNAMRNNTMYTLQIWGKAPCHKQRWLHHTCFRNWPSGAPEVLTCQVYRAAWCKTIDKIRVTNHKPIRVKLVIRAKQIVQNTNDLKKRRARNRSKKYYQILWQARWWWWVMMIIYISYMCFFFIGFVSLYIGDRSHSGHS